MTDVLLTPDGGHDAAALCEQAAAQLTEQAHTATRFADGLDGGWLGDCEEGRGWARLLQEKAVGANSLRWLLQRHAANLIDIADRFRRTTRPYGDADSIVIGRQWPTK
jgi:hypothetical protein